MTTFSTNLQTRTNCAVPARLSVLTTLLRAAALWRSRRALAKLSAAQLADVGLSAHDAAREARRPVWDAPAHWYC